LHEKLITGRCPGNREEPTIFGKYWIWVELRKFLPESTIGLASELDMRN
jgi:hypothetical protein